MLLLCKCRLFWHFLAVFFIINILLDELTEARKNRIKQQLLEKAIKAKLLMKVKRKKKIIPLPLPVPIPILPIVLYKVGKLLDADSEYYILKEEDVPPKQVVKKYVSQKGGEYILWHHY